ncbi:MAG TPA: alpha/beta hydrolase [Longimicrobiales bacterium]
MPVFQFPMVFPSDGALLAARVYRNIDDLVEPQPTVIVTGSWLTVKEQMPHTYALRLAERGLTAVTFDFTGFGRSGGAPRQLELPLRKIRDIIAAADFLSTLSFVSGRTAGHAGVCASAQYALAAIARGARIRAFASVAGWYHDAQSVAPFYGGADGVALRLGRAREALEVYATSGDVVTVPAYAPGDDRAGMFFDLDYYGQRGRGAVPEWKNAMAEMAWAGWLTFDGLSAASDVTVPTLMVHGEGCVLPENARAVYAALRGPKELVWTEGSQIDFYDQPRQVDAAVEAMVPHFGEVLGRIG